MDASPRSPASPLSRHRAHAAQVLGLALAAASAAHAAGTTVGDMDPADGTRTVLSTASAPSYGAAAPASGGNPGSFWEFTLTNPALASGQTAQVREAFVFNAASYDPCATGRPATRSSCRAATVKGPQRAELVRSIL